MPMANNQLNWSHFKPDFSGKPKEDGEVHLLRTMDWDDPPMISLKLKR